MTDLVHKSAGGTTTSRGTGRTVPSAARTGMSAGALRQAISDHLVYSIARPASVLTPEHYYRALSLAVRDRMQQRWMATTQDWLKLPNKVTCYLSAEFLMGPQLGNNLLNLGIEDAARQALAELDQDLDIIMSCEKEPGLGNGGLGRLAACYLDSLATLERPSIGYGIRYEFGIFEQEIRDGWQVEKTDNWLVYGNPWEIDKPDASYIVNWGGFTEQYEDESGQTHTRWIPQRVLKGVSYDTPIQGYGVNTCNTLTLWSARAVESFALEVFNTGDFYKAVDEEVISETVSKVLYPNDEPEAGKRLRLLQQYFFVTCSLQDILRIHQERVGQPLSGLPQKWAIQLNDTHPSIAVAELMRLLVDEHSMNWDQAWELTVATFGYTNHTLLPEALETWPLSIFGEALPRHLEIILRINERFLDEVRARFPGDEDRIRRMSLIGEDGGKCVRMAHLATVGSHAVNGVAALHSELLKASVLQDFYELWPQRFGNVTNGVTPRRFLALANPGLRELLDETIGDGWLTDLERLRGLEVYVDDRAFRESWRDVKRANKARLAEYLYATTGVELDPTWLFDVQVKRIHEYKRQHLNVLHIVTLYNRLKKNPDLLDSATCLHLRRQGGPGVLHGQADHQDDHRRRGRRQHRSGRKPFHENRFRAQLQCAERALDLSGRELVRADLDRGQGGLGHREYEVHDQRSLDHRHARRRQRGDAGGGGRGEFLPVRSERGGSGPRLRRGPPSVDVYRPGPRARRSAGPHCRRAFHRRRHRDPPSRRRFTALSRPIPGVRRLSLVRRLPSRGRRSLAGRGRVVAHVDSQCGAQWQVLLRPRDR